MDPLRARIIDELASSGRPLDETLAQIRGATRGNIVQVMRRAGVPSARALSAACRGAEIPPARGEWLRRPLSPRSHGVAPELCWKLLAAPIAREDGVLCIAFADPEVAAVGSSLWGLPRHEPHLALEEHVRAVLKATLGRPGEPAKLEEDSVPAPVDLDELSTPPPITADEAEESTARKAKITNSELESFAEGAATVAYDPSPTPARATTGGVRVGTGNVAVIDDPGIDEVYPVVGATTGDETEIDDVEATDPDAADGPTGFTGEHQIVQRQQAIKAESIAGQFDEVAATDPEGAILQYGGIRSYRLLREIGAGGMAQVFLAEKRDDASRVAIKVMDPTLARDPSFVERFRREAQATRALDHPNIVKVVDDRFEENGTYFLATEWVEGGTLRDLMSTLGSERKSYQPLVPAALVVEILAQALDGLGAAHKRNIIHRDLKPVNLMVNTSGLLKLCDFGIAKDLSSGDLTRAGVLFGTPMYMAPEQVAGEKVDARCDLFAIGTLCLEMLSGENPFDDKNIQRSLLKVSQGYAPGACELTPGVPPLLDEIISTMMRPNPKDRFSSAQEVRDALEPLVRSVRKAKAGALEAAVHNPRRTRNELLALECEGHKRAGARARAAGRHVEAIYRYGAACLARTEDEAAQAAINELTREQRIPLGDLAKLPREGVSFERASAKQGLAESNAGRGVLTALAWARRGSLAGLRGADERHLEIVGEDPLVPLGDERSTPITGSRRDDLDALRAAAVEGGRNTPLIAAGVAVLLLILAIVLSVVLGGDDPPEERPTITVPSAPARSAMAEGERLLRRGQAAEAIELLSPIVDDEVHGIDALLMRARAYLDRGASASARKDLKRVIDGTKPGDSRHQEAQALRAKAQ